VIDLGNRTLLLHTTALLKEVIHRHPEIPNNLHMGNEKRGREKGIEKKVMRARRERERVCLSVCLSV
jgi:hypothetical protein